VVQLLLVEDDPAIYDAIAPYAQSEGWRLSWARSVSEAARLLDESAPDLVLLDRGLPGIKGDALSGRLVASLIPFMMLTARGEEAERLSGFDLGADDYVTKPFSAAELMRRIAVVLRRRGSPRVRLKRDVELDREARKLFARGKDVGLTAREYALLELLARRPGRVYTREEIANHLDVDFDTLERTIDSHVKNIRHKLRDADIKATLIETAIGTGYALRSDL
jgi:DNA-binding response OmpR family regulator